MVIYGGGGHTKVIIDSLQSVGVAVDYVFDDQPTSEFFCGIPVGTYTLAQFPASPLLLGIGSNEVRRKLSSKISHRFGQVNHSTSYVAADVSLGEGSVVLLGASVNVGSVVGQHTIVNTQAVVDHDCVLGDFVHVGPSATLCGHVEVGEGTLIGAGVIVSPLVKIGSDVVIAAGRVVSKDVPNGTIVSADWV
jgi:sugar O-acyltransferase (sialic acid O-acetyltransferase NeuD family)